MNSCEMEKTNIEQEELIEAKTWDDLNIDSAILRSIYTHGFEMPSEIQRKAIPPIKSLNDVIAQAQSGTGKTGAFVIGSLSHVDVTKNVTQVIVLAPTHELVTQIFTVFTSLSSYMEGIVIRKMIGGTSVTEDMQDLRNSIPHVVVGCTGRDHCTGAAAFHHAAVEFPATAGVQV